MIERRWLGAIAGMIGPSLFVAVFTIAGWLPPGYRAREMFVSELSLGPRGWIQISNFIVTGVLLLLFARGVGARFRDGKSSRAGLVLLTIIGFGFLASGPCVMDPPSTPAEQMSWHGKLHWNVFGALVFALSPVSCFVFLRRFRAEPAWRPLQWPTIAAGITTAAAVVVMATLPTRPPEAPNRFNAWNGAVQHVFVIIYLAWIFMFAWRSAGTRAMERPRDGLVVAPLRRRGSGKARAVRGTRR